MQLSAYNHRVKLNTELTCHTSSYNYINIQDSDAAAKEDTERVTKQPGEI